MGNADSIVVFTKNKETKNTHRFEAPESGVVTGSLYIQKSKLAEVGNPSELTVTVSFEADQS
jgi:hypothetical protein